MRLAFMGSPDFAVPALTALHAAGHDIAAVYCQPPRPAGRGNRVRRCAVHEAADRLGLPVRSPARLRQDDAAQADFVALDLDVAVVAAYGLILPRAMLDAPRLGCVNIHASLLPRWRGASPIQAAIMAGDPRSGITIMRMEEGLDTGPIYGRAALPLGPRVTTSELHDALAQLGADAIQAALAGLPDATPQPAEGVTYAAKLTRADGKLDWSQDAATLDRHIRALNPWPGTFATMNGETLKILAATPEPGSGPPGQILDAGLLVACGTGALRLTRVQRPGRPAMAGDAMLRGMPGGESLISTMTQSGRE